MGRGETVPKFISKSDPAALTKGMPSLPTHNYLIDLKAAIIVDVEAVGAARTMIERTEERLGLCPERLAADSAAEMLGWLVNEHALEPHTLPRHQMADIQRCDHA